MTHTFGSTIVLERSRSFEDFSQVVTPQTQSGGNGGGTSVPFAPCIPSPENDDEPQAVALAAEAFLIRQRIAQIGVCGAMEQKSGLGESSKTGISTRRFSLKTQ